MHIQCIILFMFDFCTDGNFIGLCDEWSNRPGQKGTTMLDGSRTSDTSVTVDTILIILNGVIQGVAVSEKLEFIMSAIDEAQTVSQREMVLR